MASSQVPLDPSRSPVGPTIYDAVYGVDATSPAVSPLAAASTHLPQTALKPRMPFDSLEVVAGKSFSFLLPKDIDKEKIGEVLWRQMQFAFNNGLVKLAKDKTWGDLKKEIDTPEKQQLVSKVETMESVETLINVQVPPNDRRSNLLANKAIQLHEKQSKNSSDSKELTQVVNSLFKDPIKNAAGIDRFLSYLASKPDKKNELNFALNHLFQKSEVQKSYKSFRSEIKKEIKNTNDPKVALGKVREALAKQPVYLQKMYLMHLTSRFDRLIKSGKASKKLKSLNQLLKIELAEMAKV